MFVLGINILFYISDPLSAVVGADFVDRSPRSTTLRQQSAQIPPIQRAAMPVLSRGIADCWCRKNRRDSIRARGHPTGAFGIAGGRWYHTAPLSRLPFGNSNRPWARDCNAPCLAGN